jgi:hypothetical protein
MEKKSQQEMEFILASLRAELLHDLLSSMSLQCEDTKKDEPPSSGARLKFYLLAIAGTVLAACEGFDSISSMLGLFTLPPVVVLLSAVACSIFSIIIFYGFNLVQVSNNLGVKISETPKLLDIYLQQLNEIKGIRKKINTYKLSELSSEELQHLTKTLEMLTARFDALRGSSKQFAEALDSPKMNIMKNLFAGSAGLLFFGGGFLAGQSAALFLLGFILPAVTATAWPVVLFSVVVGCAAFSLYWYVEKVGLQQLISGWFGLDEEKIETLCDSKQLDKQAYKLQNLKEKIIDMAALVRQKEELKEQCDPYVAKKIRTNEVSPLSARVTFFDIPRSQDEASDSQELQVCLLQRV